MGRFRPLRHVGLLGATWLVLAAVSGCASAGEPRWKSWFGRSAEAAPTGPADSLILRAGALETDYTIPPALQAELDGAKKLFQEKEYAKAERIFHRLAGNSKNPPRLLEEALFYEAEAQYLQGNLRSAEPNYKRLLQNHRYGRYQEDANRRLFDIANYWLDDTRKLMQAYEEKREGKRWFVMPASYVHFSRDKPLLDTEGHALQALEEVRLNDLKGELGERALFYIATVKFFREEYRDADYYYAQLYENYPNSALAPKAIKQAIICKQLIAGGPVYDSRPTEEARKLIDTAARAYPQFNAKDDKFLQKSLVSIHLHQADRDLRVAQFYERTGHPGSAYFYYELVRRRYPGTEYSQKAVERMAEIRGRLEQEEAAPEPRPGNAFSDPGQRVRDAVPRLLPPFLRKE